MSMTARRGNLGAAAFALLLALAALSGCSDHTTAAGTTGGGATRTMTVPDVAGLAPRKAIAELCAAGFGVNSVTVARRTRQVDRAHPADGVRVVGTTPPGGAVVTSVTVPAGSGTTTVPVKPVKVPVTLRLREPWNVAVAFKVPVC
jgi:beta-lactam-binding protein with PASTA domain